MPLRPTGEDLVWVVRQLVEMTPLTVFEEVQRQNQEVLRLLLELQACQARLAELALKPAEPAAA